MVDRSRSFHDDWANMRELRFAPGTRAQSDNWSQNGEKISSPEKLGAIRAVLEGQGPILVEHKFLRGGCAPATLVFDDFDVFITYLEQHARAGDKIHVWNLWPFMRDSPALAYGKCPDVDGAVPEGGAY
jgi:hypothetical protein